MPSNARPTNLGEGGISASTDRATSPRELERQLAIAQQITHIGSWEWEISTNVVRWSDELYRIYGLEPQSIEITFQEFLSRIHPEDRARIQSAVGLAIERGGRFAHRERIIRPDGSMRHLDSIGEVVHDAAGKRVGLIGTCRDITEELARDETLRLYANIVQSIPVGFSVWRAGRQAEPTLVAFNPAIERAAGIPLSDHVGKPVEQAIPVSCATQLSELLTHVSEDHQVHELSQCVMGSADGQSRIFAARAFPLPGDTVGLSLEDVTSQVRSRQLQAEEQRVLEMVVSGTDLETVLSTLVLAIEKHAPPALGSILLLDAEGAHIQHGAAPNLPETYNRAIDGEPIGPGAGSCGTAAHLGQAVFVEDIATDPLWAAYREVALEHGLRACWSTPIHSSEGRVLGTFALYYRQPRKPVPEDLELIARATHVASIAIERKRLDEQLRALTARIEAVREDERTEVAREIHDELGQALTALKMDVAWMLRHGPPSAGDAARARLASMSQMIDGVIDQVRRISAQLRPGVLDDLGLAAAVEWQAREFSRRCDIPCHVHSNVEEARLERDLSTAVFRILQEALTNVARHAHATRVDISLWLESGQLGLDVRDDGVGIAEDAVSHPSSLGLLGMRERARRLGGSLRAIGGPGKGTLIEVRVPISDGRAA